MAASAYLTALRMLARRELSERQIRERLARRGYDPSAIDVAVARLLADRSLDDRRVAEALARTALARGRGRLRVQRSIEDAGIARSLAQQTVDSVFAEVDAQALLIRAVERRLHGRPGPVDERELQRLYRYLIGQGFESDRVLALLRARRKASD